MIDPDKYHPLSVCVDCIMLLANGDLPEENTEEQDEEFLADIDERWKGYQLSCGWMKEEYEARDIDMEDEEADQLGFSHQPCDCCGSHLGGDRFPVTAFEVKKKEVI